MPDPGPLGDTFLEASVLAMVAASLVNNPGRGWVESVVTLTIHLLFFLLAGIGFSRPYLWMPVGANRRQVLLLPSNRDLAHTQM
jgi:hypothetical protein